MPVALTDSVIGPYSTRTNVYSLREGHRPDGFIQYATPAKPRQITTRSTSNFFTRVRASVEGTGPNRLASMVNLPPSGNLFSQNCPAPPRFPNGFRNRPGSPRRIFPLPTME